MTPDKRRMGKLIARVTAVLTATAFLTAGAARAQERIETFRLQTMDRSRTYGPFELGSGKRVFIGGDAYTVHLTADKKIKFVSPDADKVFGPFDFVAGRIVELGSGHFTLIDIRRIQAPKAGIERPAEPPAAPAPKPVPLPPSPSPPPPAPGVVEKGARPIERPEAGGALGVRAEIVDITRYDAGVAGVLSKSDTTVERRGLSIFADRGPFGLQAGVTFNGEWSEKASEPGLAFEDAELRDGKGWWIAARYTHDFYRDNEWRVNLYGEASYRSEDYSIEYGQWVSTLVYTPGTNDTGGLEPVIEFRESSADITLSEFGLRLGGGIAYEGAGWWCRGSLEVMALSETDLDGGIVAGEDTYDIEFDRALPVCAAGVIGLKAGDYRFFVEGRAGGEMQLGLGAARAVW